MASSEHSRSRSPSNASDNDSLTSRESKHSSRSRHNDTTSPLHDRRSQKRDTQPASTPPLATVGTQRQTHYPPQEPAVAYVQPMTQQPHAWSQLDWLESAGASGMAMAAHFASATTTTPWQTHPATTTATASSAHHHPRDTPNSHRQEVPDEAVAELEATLAATQARSRILAARLAAAEDEWSTERSKWQHAEADLRSTIHDLQIQNQDLRNSLASMQTQLDQADGEITRLASMMHAPAPLTLVPPSTSLQHSKPSPKISERQDPTASQPQTADRAEPQVFPASRAIPIESTPQERLDRAQFTGSAAAAAMGFATSEDDEPPPRRGRSQIHNPNEGASSSQAPVPDQSTRHDEKQSAAARLAERRRHFEGSAAATAMGPSSAGTSHSSSRPSPHHSISPPIVPDFDAAAVAAQARSDRRRIARRQAAGSTGLWASESVARKPAPRSVIQHPIPFTDQTRHAGFDFARAQAEARHRALARASALRSDMLVQESVPVSDGAGDADRERRRQLLASIQFDAVPSGTDPYAATTSASPLRRMPLPDGPSAASRLAFERQLMELEAKRIQLETGIDQARAAGNRRQSRPMLAALSAELVATGEQISALRAMM